MNNPLFRTSLRPPSPPSVPTLAASIRVGRTSRSAADLLVGPVINSALLILILLLSACTVGPHYRKPPAPVPQAFKEGPPTGWKEAQPSDEVIRGKWWELYNDPQLNELEDQVSITNQNVLQAEARFRASKYAVRIARAALFPTLTTSPAITASRAGGGLVQATNGTGGTATVPTGGNGSSSIRQSYSLPVDFSYQVDLWGSIRRNVRANAETAQATAAQLEDVRLAMQAELAQDYFQLRGTDSNQQLLESTVKSYEEFLTLTKNRFNGGVATGADVAQAETQLSSAQEQLIDLGVARTQFEHAIAALIGKPPADLTIAFATLTGTPPPVPVAVPSTLLERRPDIATAERQMAALHEQIGIAQAAYYPSLTLSAAGGFQSSSFTSWFTWPSRFFSFGAGAGETLFDAGRRRGEVAQAQDLYDAGMANYRQVVLTAFQQVEDNLSALRILADEAVANQVTIDAAQRSLDISTYQYKAGVATYLQVITAQTALFGEQRAALGVLTRRMVSSVTLIEALGGGWQTSQLPSITSLGAKP